MIAPRQDDIDDDRELASQPVADPVRAALSAAVSSLFESLPDCAARKAAIIEIMESEGRIRRAMIKKIVH